MSTKKRNIRNPEKWIGRYVRHMANWDQYAWAHDNQYIVCEWTGKLQTIADYEFGRNYTSDELVTAHPNYDECYYYSSEALMFFENDMRRRLNETGQDGAELMSARVELTGLLAA